MYRSLAQSVLEMFDKKVDLIDGVSVILCVNNMVSEAEHIC